MQFWCSYSTNTDSQPLAITDEIVHRALDPGAVIAARSLPGGPAPHRMRQTITESAARLHADRTWLTGTRKHLSDATRIREQTAATRAQTED